MAYEALTHEQKLDIYREIEREFDLEDTRYQIGELIEFHRGSAMGLALQALTNDDVDCIATAYRNDYDCNYSSNDQLQNTIEEFITIENVYARPDCGCLLLYERYKKEWLVDHIDSATLAKTREEYMHRSDDDSTLSFEEYVGLYGYSGGQLYSCFEEFLEGDIESYL